MSAISMLNPKAEFARAAQALSINISAARGIAEVMKSNLGPKGTMKMLVSGAGDIKLTKDGNILLHEMQIQHPTASLIAKASTAHDDVVGDGTTSIVLLIGEIMKQADAIISEGVHPRIIVDGLNIAKESALEVLEGLKLDLLMGRTVFVDVAQTALRTKIHPKLADHLAELCADAVLSVVEEDGKTADLHMIEMMEMQHRNEYDTCLVKGLVMDHGGRHPDMPKSLKNCFILTCNVSLEYEKTEVNSGFFYKTAEEREKLLSSEREFIDQRVKKIVELKNQVCPKDSDKSFVVINQKGIDPISLDILAKNGILALRRAKRRNMERLSLACGGMAMNSFDDMTADCLGYAGLVYEHVLGEDKYTFVEECKNPKSVTLLLKGPMKHGIVQMKDAIRDAIRSVYNAMQDGCAIPGAGAFEMLVSKKLTMQASQIKNRSVLGVNLFAQAILVIPKTLVMNAGHDPQEAILSCMSSDNSDGSGDFYVGEPLQARGVDLNTGKWIESGWAGIYDIYAAKRQMIDASIVVATNLLLTDEIMRAGLSSLK
ncbi:T-complex protein 1 subunit zeta [Folsomia candida]|uniref:Chaperonin n=1 Tax=Folsomia candida TaxID=158441 RepID=A0A481SY60_FOLCA|nr:T-complex protein 1 subunit zeta [Folsomia candida]QBH73706.1 chaperonin [Folsomia candida]